MDTLADYAYEMRDLTIIDKAWRSMVVPLRCFVLSRVLGEFVFTLVVTEYGFFGWPAIRVAGATMTLDLSITALTYFAVVQFAELTGKSFPKRPSAPYMHACMAASLPSPSPSSSTTSSLFPSWITRREKVLQTFPNTS